MHGKKLSGMHGKEMKGFYSVRQTADMLGVNRETVRLLIVKDELEVYYVDNVYLIPEASIKKLKKRRSDMKTKDRRYKVV